MTGTGPTLVLAGALLVVALAYLVPALRLAADGRWRADRIVSWCAGIVAAAAAVAGPVADAAHHDLVAHMVGHLLLGMLAPLLLVRAAPVTLALRALPTAGARRLVGVLRTPPVRVVTHPAVAAVLNVGGLWLLYTTPLYPAMAGSGAVHVLVHAHVLLAGVLFTAAVVGVDPMPHRPSHPVRATALVAALAAHSALAKYLVAHPPEGTDPGRAELAGMVMYYGGDVVDALLLVLLCASWYRATAPGRRSGRGRAAAGHRRGQPLSPKRSTRIVSAG